MTNLCPVVGIYFTKGDQWARSISKVSAANKWHLQIFETKETLVLDVEIFFQNETKLFN